MSEIVMFDIDNMLEFVKSLIGKWMEYQVRYEKEHIADIDKMINEVEQ